MCDFLPKIGPILQNFAKLMTFIHNMQFIPFTAKRLAIMNKVKSNICIENI